MAEEGKAAPAGVAKEGKTAPAGVEGKAAPAGSILLADLAATWQHVRETISPALRDSPGICSGCFKPSAKILKCTRCKHVVYCSPECQKLDWKEHKPICDPAHEYWILSVLLSRVHNMMGQPAFTNILASIKKQDPGAGMIIVDFENLLRASPNPSQQSDHIIWHLIGGSKDDIVALPVDKLAKWNIREDPHLQLGIFYRGKLVRAYKMREDPVIPPVKITKKERAKALKFLRM